MARVKIVRQQYAMQCGAACLCMVARAYGMRYALNDMECYCRPGKRGVSMLAISQASDKIGLIYATQRLSVNQLLRHSGPAILYWNKNHFVVYCGRKRNGNFIIADPGKGKYCVDKEEFERMWINSTKCGVGRGIAMLFDGCSKEGADSVKKSGNTAFHVKQYVSKYRSHLLIVGLSLVTVSILQMILPFTTKIIVDKGIGNRDISLVWLVLAGELAIILGRTVTDFVRRWLMLHVSVRVNVDLMSSFLSKLLRLPMSFFDIRLLGDLVQRTSDHYRVQTFLTGQTLSLIFTVVNFVAFGFVLFLFNAKIFGIYLVATVFYGIWIVAFLRKRKLIDYEYFEKNCINENITYDFLTNIQETKLQGCGKRHQQKWESTQADLLETQVKSMKLQQMQEVGSTFINELKNIVITVISAQGVIDGSMSFGDMMAVEYIIGQLNAPVSQIMGFVYSLQDVGMSLDRINEIHNRHDENQGRTVRPLAVGGAVSVSIRNLEFNYESASDRLVLDNLSLEIPAGKTTAIVGLSGSGKSTLLKMIMGYYSEYKGSIEINGIDIRLLDIETWRGCCGVVMQESAIFPESIARNIAVADGDIDDDKLIYAAKTAKIYDYIMSLPLKFNTIVGSSGRSLSQGQKQRILIARAIYRNPSLLILDEATNSLDAINENEIVNNLDDFFKGRTVLIVAHRLSTIRNADCIMVMENGKIVESGSHELLLSKRGRYYNLVSKQLEIIE